MLHLILWIEKKCIYILFKILVPSFLFEMILRQTLFIRLLHVQNEEVQDHVEGSEFKQRFLETTLENPNDNVRKYVMKTFKCIKRCQIASFKIP